MTVWVLEGGAKVDTAIDIVANQELNLAERAGQDFFDRSVGDGVVSSGDSLVCWGELVESGQDARLERSDICSEKNGRVYVSYSIVNIRQEGWITGFGAVLAVYRACCGLAGVPRCGHA